MGVGKKRVAEGSAPKAAKKPRSSTGGSDIKGKAAAKAAAAGPPPPAPAPTGEIDFPRGGGTALTPFEYKEATKEAAREAAEGDLFDEGKPKKKTKLSGHKDSKGAKTFKKASAGGGGGKQSKDKPESDVIRVEHLNYKRLIPGTRLLGVVQEVTPLNLIISLPNQLLGHVPITNISSQLTARLEAAADASDDEEGDEESSVGGGEEEEGSEAESPSKRKDEQLPGLGDLFAPGQFVRAIVAALHSAGANLAGAGGPGRQGGGELERASRRVELSLVPEKVNEGVLLEDLAEGFTLVAAVKSVEDHGYLLHLGVADMTAFVTFKEATQVTGKKRWMVGQLVDVVVKKLAENGRTCTVGVTREEVSTAVLKEAPTVSSLLPGAFISSLITAVTPTGLNLKLFGMFDGTVDLFHIPPSEAEDPTKSYKLGKRVKARIIWDSPAAQPKHFALSIVPSVAQMEAPHVETELGSGSLQDVFPVGTVIEEVRVERVMAEWGLVVSIAHSAVKGFVHISHVADHHVPSLSPNDGAYRIGSIHRARVVGHVLMDNVIQLSLKPSVLEKKFMRVSEVVVGQLMRGSVKRVSDNAIFVNLDGNVDGVVWAAHMAETKLRHPEKKFKPGQVVKCRILATDPERNRISLTLKKTLVGSELPIVASSSDAKPGIVTHGTVSKFFEKGMLVDLYGSVRAFVHAGEASDSYVTNITDHFTLGQVVKVRITHVDRDTGRIRASVRQALPNYQPPAKSAPKSAAKEADLDAKTKPKKDGEKKQKSVKEEPAPVPAPGEEGDQSDGGDFIELDDGRDSGVEVEGKNGKPSATLSGKAKPEPHALTVQGGFSWSRPDEDEDEASSAASDDEDESDSGAGTSKSKKKKRRKGKTPEEDLTADLSTRAPQSNTDFERLLLGSPNSSYLWIQYMSFQLQLSEVDKAREIGKRALKSMSFREEQEKLNVWIAMLNLENSYGTDESLELTFREACLMNEAKHIHLKLADIFVRTEKFEKAEEMFQKTVKKFGQSSKTWTLFGQYYFERHQAEDARTLLPRSLKSLPKRKHVKTITKFAMMEFKIGDPERGQTIFEGVIDSYPKRLDLWNVYIDQETRLKNIGAVRGLFDRLLSQKLSSKKVKSFLKKFLQVEKNIGDPAGEEAVKQRAFAYVQSREAQEADESDEDEGGLGIQDKPMTDATAEEEEEEEEEDGDEDGDEDEDEDE